MGRKYTIGGKEYSLKEKYSLKSWGKILKTLSEAEETSRGKTDEKEKAFAITVALISGDRLETLLNEMLDRPLESELMEDDVEEVTKAITDFFSRKNAFFRSAEGSSLN